MRQQVLVAQNKNRPMTSVCKNGEEEAVWLARLRVAGLFIGQYRIGKKHRLPTPTPSPLNTDRGGTYCANRSWDNAVTCSPLLTLLSALLGLHWRSSGDLAGEVVFGSMVARVL